MLSLGAMKDGVILPSEEDRKRIITQMKVRTTLKGDKSWIQQRSDSEEKQNRRPLHSMLRTRSTTGQSTSSVEVLPPNRRVSSSQAEPQSSLDPKSPPKKMPNSPASPGYLIRGVFTKTVDRAPPSNAASSGTHQRLACNAEKVPKSNGQTPFAQGNKMSTEDYKKLAPFNIKRELSQPGEEEPSVSPEEQKKRTEAASSVLRRTASRERSYVFSAAKKSGGSPVQEVPAYVAKKIDVEENIGLRSRSQTVPASAWFNSRRKSSDTNNSRNSASKPYSESTLKHSSSTECSEKSELQSPRLSDNKPVDHLIDQPSSQGFSALPESSSSSCHARETNSITGYGSASNTSSYPRDEDMSSSRSTLDHKEGVPNKVSNGEGKYKALNSRTEEFCKHHPIPEETLSEHENPRLPEFKKVEAHLAMSDSLPTENTFAASSENHFSQPGPGTDSAGGLRILPHLHRQARNFIRSSGSRNGTTSQMSSQLYNNSMWGVNHGLASYLYQQPFGSRRTPYYPVRDNSGMVSPRSHRMPFYKDICESEMRRNLTDSNARKPAGSSQMKNSSPFSYDSDSSTSSKGLLFVKESIKSTERSSSRYNSRSLIDLSELEKPSYGNAGYLNSIPPKRSLEDVCTYCGRVIRNCAKITVENLNICCHEYCFRCGICHKPMGDLLDKIFIHRDIVHCDKCYEKLF